ncbi:VOC family protein [Pilimelia anulata]|nr:VOC family protein [Pilimelia anulata]
MTARTAHLPIWVDLATPDPAAAADFYGPLFGWTSQPGARSPGYLVFRKDGRAVAGAGALAAHGEPAAWSTYVGTEDIDATVRRAEAAGAKLLAAPEPVAGEGSAAALADPAGAPFALWQPAGMAGAELFNAPGALCWNELATRDAAGSAEFYGAVFDWVAVAQPMGAGSYTTFRRRGEERPVAGMIEMAGEQWPAELPAHWLPYFAVLDTDAAAQQVEALGGMVCVPPTDIPEQGRFAVLADPAGGTFCVITAAG